MSPLAARVIVLSASNPDAEPSQYLKFAPDQRCDQAHAQRAGATMLRYHTLATPCGPLLLVIDEQGLRHVDFCHSP
ncbi:MAG: hypothetical protein ACRCRW_11025, partial [Aeromonadaceae bacterium]